MTAEPPIGLPAGPEDGTRDEPRWYWPAVLGVLAAFAVLVTWNAFHYDARGGFEAEAHFDYVTILREERRLPTPDEVHNEWQIPPVFHIAAAILQSSCESFGGPAELCDTGLIVQIFNAVAAWSVSVLIFLAARQLLPSSPVAHIGTLLITAMSPPLVRASVMFYGETLATAFSAAAVVLAGRALSKVSGGAGTSAAAGLFVGLAILTRQMGGATFAALCLAYLLHSYWVRDARAIRVGLLFAATAVLVSAPWFIHQQVVYGSPVAQGLEPPEDVPFFERQPLEFYVGGPVTPVFTMPYRPSFANHMPQTLYSDWWGDYFGYFHTRPYIGHVPLPSGYHNELVAQSYVGILPTLLIIGGFVSLAREGSAQRDAKTLIPTLIASFVAGAALYFFIGFPVNDGDTMKSIYLLTALPAVAIAGGWSLAKLQQYPVVFRLIGGILVVTSVINVRFLWLENRVIP